MATAQTVTNSMITDPTALAASIANSGWNDWSNNLSPYLQARMFDATGTTDRVAGSAWQAAGMDHNQATSMIGDYNSIYRPAGQNFSNLINKYGTSEYSQSQANKAAAGVQQQIDAQQAQQARAMQRSGVNPASGRMLAMQNQNAIMGAAAKAGAMNQARDQAEAKYASGLKDLNSMGLDTVKASDILNKSGQGWANLGMDATKAGAGFGIAYGDLASNATLRAGSVASSAANAANQTSQTNSNIQALKDSNSIPNLLLSGVVKAGSTALNGVATDGTKWLMDWAKGKLTNSTYSPSDNSGLNSPGTSDTRVGRDSGQTPYTGSDNTSGTSDYVDSTADNAAPETPYTPSDDDWYMQ